MQLVIEPTGEVRCIYSERLDVRTLGQLDIRRASHVEPTPTGGWHVDLTPVGGPVMSNFGQRSEALAAEHAWLEEHWLSQPDI